MISDKSKCSSDIILMENDSIVNDPMCVADTLNDYFVNVANGIGEPGFITEDDTFESIISKHEYDECVNTIRYDMIRGSTPSFSFNEMTDDEVLKKLRKVNIKKSMLKLGTDYLCKVCKIFDKYVN